MKKVLMIGDAGCRTGFARVVKGVADRLHATGWEVVVRAINYQDDHGIEYPYEVLPMTYGDTDPTGAATLGYHIDDVKPDVLWALQDPWHIQGYSAEKPKELPSVCYVPVDTPCIKWESGLALGSWSQCASYTWFGAHELAASAQEAVDVLHEHVGIPKEGQARWASVPIAARRVVDIRLDRLARLQNIAAWNVIPHGRTPGQFELRDKVAARKHFGIDEDAFVVGFVGGNQPRKRLDTAMRAFATAAVNDPKALLVFHCWGGDDQGWDLAALARFYGIGDKVLAVHWKWKELSDDDLCTLYNCFDVHLNTSGGEGWALTTSESAECAVAQIVPDWAATREIWRDHALGIQVTGWHHMAKYLNTAHCELSVDNAAGLIKALKDPEYRTKMGTLARERVLQLPTWDDVGDGFAVLLDKAIKEPEALPTSLNDMMRERIERIWSEVHPDAPRE
jgi:glycosyltransferase involved in cell wall biosynthesis